MNGFHTQKNLFFSRQPDGSVEITKYRDDMPWSAGGPSEEPLFRQVVDADSWCSVIASMSAGGEADLRFFAAQTFHRSAGAISIQREHPPTGGSNG